MKFRIEVSLGKLQRTTHMEAESFDAMACYLNKYLVVAKINLPPIATSESGKVQDKAVYKITDVTGGTGTVTMERVDLASERHARKDGRSLRQEEK